MNINKTAGNGFLIGLNRPEILTSPEIAPGESAVKPGKRICRPGRFLIATLLAAVLMVLTGASGAWGDTYTSENSQYPDAFGNDTVDTQHNDFHYIDAAYFIGREIVFFTMWSSESAIASSKLYYYTPDFNYHGSLDIGNSPTLDFRIKTCVYNDVLYVFYTTPSSTDGFSKGRIYYRTVTADTGPSGLDWNLVFSEEKNFAAGVAPATILLAAEMNGALYVIFSSGKDWYYIVSYDGLNFVENSGTKFFTSSDGLYGPGGAVFQAPDDEGGFADRLMLADCPGNGANHAITYFFFDGKSAYGENSISTPDLSPHSVRLITGSAQGYNNKYYSIQVFLASPNTSGDTQAWSSIYHREYVPSGGSGDEGTWSSTWTHLSNSNDDDIYCVNAYDSDPGWSVIPSYADEDGNARMSLCLWYARGTDYTWPSTDHIKFRVSSYLSDLLEFEEETITEPETAADLNAVTIIGVIEGTPPFPENGGDLGDTTRNTSVVSLGTSTTTDVSTTYNVSAGVGVTYNRKVLPFGMGSVGAKISCMLKYTNTTTTSTTAAISETFKSYFNMPPGNLGWVLMFLPQIITDRYCLKSYDGSILVYGDDAISHEFDIFLVQYGEGSMIVPKAYYLNAPDYPVGGTNTYPEIFFSGMAPRPLSTDMSGWLSVKDEYTASIALFTYENLLPNSGSISSTQGQGEEYQMTSGSSDWETYSPSVSFSLSLKKLGFTFDTSISYSMDMTTKTTISDNLGFSLRTPACGEDGADPCVKTMTVTPIVLTPNADDTGYDAPWISDYTRNNNQPKPWCLSYLINPQYSQSTVGLEEFSVKDASARLYLNRVKPNKDELSAEITLSGLPDDFSPQDLALLHFKFGDYVVHTDRNPIVKYSATNEKVVVRFEEPGNPDAFIRLTLRYKPARNLLHMDIDAHGIDLSELESYLTSGGESGGVPDTLPFSFFMDNKYYATADLAASIRIYEKKIKCRLRADE